MIKLSLTRIHADSPYELILSGGNIVFETDYGIHYSISFSKEDIILGGCETYQFIIRKIDSVHTPHDPKVERTILAIINEFFRSNLDVMLYLCDTSDGREESRDRLFLRWFENHARPGQFTIRTAHTVIEGQGLYIGIIVENRNPKLELITNDFDEKAAMLTDVKP